LATGKLEIAPRKAPQQERSRLMQQRIVDAAARVLADEGPLAFTTTAVAGEAGISVGSLYQYFPNKHALAAAIHQRRVEEGLATLQSILGDETLAPAARIVALTQWFFAAEAADVQDLGGVVDVDAFDHRTTASEALETKALALLAEFLRTHSRRRHTRASAQDDAAYLMLVIESVGKGVAGRGGGHDAVEHLALRTGRLLATSLGL
jgi:AcrR family transcriptional regulator